MGPNCARWQNSTRWRPPKNWADWMMPMAIRPPLRSRSRPGPSIETTATGDLGLRQNERLGIADLILDRGVGIELIMACGIGSPVPDIAIGLGSRSGRTQMHKAKPI